MHFARNTDHSRETHRFQSRLRDYGDIEWCVTIWSYVTAGYSIEEWCVTIWSYVTAGYSIEEWSVTIT